LTRSRLPLTRLLWLWIPVIAYMIAIFVGQSMPNPPEPPGALTDKHEHFFFYGVLAVLVLRALANARWRRITAGAACGAIAFAALYGVVNEWHQRFVPGRSYDVFDMIANTIGSVLAVGLVWAWSIIRRRSETHDVL
jgi:VanZ family protein